MAALPFSGPQLASIGTGLGLVFGGEQHALGSLEGRHRAQCINPRIDPVKHGLMSEPVLLTRWLSIEPMFSRLTLALPRAASPDASIPTINSASPRTGMFAL